VTRYFRSNDELLAQVTAQLDAAYGYPNAETKTNTSLPHPSECPHDSEGRVYIAVDDTYCDFILPSQMLSQLISSGLAEEVNAAVWDEVVATLPPGEANNP
jgi:hypothetical protein